MKNVYAYIDTKREKVQYRPLKERIKDYKEVELRRTDTLIDRQAGRCMNCGTPFCHNNCPLGNYIPEWNDLAKEGKWKEAWERLSLTSPFPEFTGRLCPALCEGGCVLGINDDPVTIRQNELDIIEKAFQLGYVKPVLPKKRTGKNIAIIGSGPAALSAAHYLNRKGHCVEVFERSAKPGGFLRYGIPDFKLDKSIIDRRITIMREEGIVFTCSTEIGITKDAKKLRQDYDAVILACGTRSCRGMNVSGSTSSAVIQAVDYLTASNKAVSKEETLPSPLCASGKRVVVIGGGDTGSDCVGTANRQGSLSVHQIEIMDKLPEERPLNQSWPEFPRLFKHTSSHEEGVTQDYCVLTKSFQVNADGKLEGLNCAKVQWDFSSGKPVMKEIDNSDFFIQADMVILAMGFTGAEDSKMLKDLGLPLSSRSIVETDTEYKTSIEGVFACGDMRRGQSLIVHALTEGKYTAQAVDHWLMNK